MLAVLGPLRAQRSAAAALAAVRLPRAALPIAVRRDRPSSTGRRCPSRVLAALGPEPLAVDELIRQCDAAAPEVQAALLELELAGRIDRQPGNRVCLRAG